MAIVYEISDTMAVAVNHSVGYTVILIGGEGGEH